MAETVKKSRIVSGDDDNLEESLLEEFNMRLKNCMSEDNLQLSEEQVQQQDALYENIKITCNKTRPIPRSGGASKDFIQVERESYYDQPISMKNGSKEEQNGHNTDDETENIYETLPEHQEIEKTDHLDQYVDMSSPEITKNNLKLDVVSPTTGIQVENANYEEFEIVNKDLADSSYEFVENEKPSFMMKTTDFSENKSPESDTKSSVKDRMFLATDDAATLLFTQTVTSPMLTPSEENIDFLKGFQRENTSSDNTVSTSNESPEKEATDKATNEENNTSEISEEISVSEPLAVENKTVDGQENIYENAAFLKQNANIYENLKERRDGENVYENLKDLKKDEQPEENEENIYQDIEDCKKVYENLEDFIVTEKLASEEVFENDRDNEEIKSPGDEMVTDLDQTEEYEEPEGVKKDGHPVNFNNLEGVEKINESHTEHYNTSEEIFQHSETVKHSESVKLSSKVEHSEMLESNTDHSESNENTESYSEFVHHSKTESNYYEKYTEVVSKNSKNVEISNREKDTETVPPEIVKNLKSQFLKTGAEIVSITKKEVGDVSELKTINIMKQINKFEHKDAGETLTTDLDDSTVTQCYSETTTIQSDVPGEKALKKKKSKKSRKEEKENISVNGLDNVDGQSFYNVNVKNLKSSFSKFDALQKQNVIHVRSSDSTKAQEKFNGSQQIDTTNCRACSKQVFQMEQIKAEKAIWHKNCFRCTECSKQLTVETYVSHEGNLYCKPHFKSLFAPKVVEDEAPPSDKPDLGLEELQSLNVKERFQVFEHHQTEVQESDRGPTPVNVKRSPSILSKLARFQAKGMDVGVSDEALNGIPIEESSSEEEEEEDEVPEGEDPTLYKAKRVQKEKPFHFTNLSEVKNKWEHGEQNNKDERREERKQEIQTIRNRLFMGKQGKMKEAYQQAVMQSESCTNLAKSERIESCDTKSLKERFEKGEPFNGREIKEGEDDEEAEVFQSEISKNSRSLFLELDANASKPPQISPVIPQKLDVKKARETETPEREIYHDPDVIRAEDGYVDDSVIAKTTHTASKMLNKFRQMEENLSKDPEPAGPKPLKRFTPPPEPTRPESSEEESGSEEEESDEEDQVDNRVPDDLLEAQKAARAKQLRAKFEKWEAQEIKKEQTNTVNIVEEYGEESQIETTKALRARFESMRDSSSDKTRTPRVKVNRFVEIPSITDMCQSCKGRVYPLEKISIHGHIYHKNCFRCMECSCILRMDSYSYNQGLLYCMPHFKRLFISKGNYDTAFGLDQHKEKWNINATMA